MMVGEDRVTFLQTHDTISDLVDHSDRFVSQNRHRSRVSSPDLFQVSPAKAADSHLHKQLSRSDPGDTNLLDS